MPRFTNPPRTQSHHDHAACIRQALHNAETVCAEHDARLTPLRRRVLELIWHSHQPVLAYDLLDRLRGERARAAPPTIYRALDFLMAQGLVHRIESLNAFIGCSMPGHEHSGQFLICDRCQSVAELDDTDIDELISRRARDSGYEVARQTVEVIGRCHACSAPYNRGPPPLSNRNGGEPLLDLRSIAMTYGGDQVLVDVNLEVCKGEIVTLIGPNGSGKTTLVRIALGLVNPSQGEVLRARTLRIGYVPQRVHVDRTLPLTVRRFLSLGRRSTVSVVERILGEVGALRVLDAPVQDLSGGEMRRILLARALLQQPELLVLDEPTAGVDVSGQAEFYSLIERLRRERGCSVLLVSHDLHLVMATTDRVICINRHICCQGAPRDVAGHPEYLMLYGSRLSPGLSVYTHHHDHAHDVHGNVHGPTGTSGRTADHSRDSGHG